MAEGIEPKPFSDAITVGTFTKSTDGNTYVYNTILKKSGNLVEFYCEINAAYASYIPETTLTIGTIQEGFRPAYRRIVPIEVNDGSGNVVTKSFGDAYIYGDGTVKFNLKERGFASFSAVYFI